MDGDTGLRAGVPVSKEENMLKHRLRVTYDPGEKRPKREGVGFQWWIEFKKDTWIPVDKPLPTGADMRTLHASVHKFISEHWTVKNDEDGKRTGFTFPMSFATNAFTVLPMLKRWQELMPITVSRSEDNADGKGA
jgi:hypothetical protein